MSDLQALLAAWGPLAPAGEGVMKAAPTAARGWATFVTDGLRERELPIPAELDGTVPARVELVTYALPGEDWPAAMLARLTGLAETGQLLPYAAIDLGGPVDEASALTAVLLLPPYFETDEVAALGGGEASLLWAVPITVRELELAVLAGGRALEQVLIAADLAPAPLLDRDSLI